MDITEADYFFAAIAMACMDDLATEQVLIAASIAETGEQFDAAIWAAIRLQELTR